MKLINKVARKFGFFIRRLKFLPIGTDFYFDLNRHLNKKILVMFDVGANVGQTASEFRNNFPTAGIHCFEPISKTFAELSLESSGDDNIKLNNFALGSKKESLEVSLYEDEYSVLNTLNRIEMNDSIHAQKEIVEVDTLDNYCTENKITHIDLLKIDVEGWEKNVLLGAANMLSQKKLVLYFANVGFRSQTNGILHSRI